MVVIGNLPCSNSTKNRYIALIRAILYKARDEWNWIDTAPKLTQYKEPTKRIRWLKPDEAQRLIAALPENFWRQMAIFSLCTGLRHTWASWLVQSGVPLLLALKEMGGWEKLDMVM